jgi:integrase
MTKITKRTVDAATPDPHGRFIVWDEQIKGFGLLVLPTGVKSYLLKYRTAEGRQRRATIGQHGDWTPDQARQRADEWRQIVRARGDPLGAKLALREAPTVDNMLDAYLASERFLSKAASTRATDIGRIERHLRPLLGKKHLHALTPGEIERAFAQIRDGRTATRVKTGYRGLARVTGGIGAATESIKLLRTIFRWAVREGLAEANPAEHVKTGVSCTRDTILDDSTAYGRLFETLDRMQSERRIRGAVADAIRLIALTGARRGEVAGLRWSHVDLKRGLITLPPSSHKTGRRTGKARVIGLPAAAQAVIACQPAGEPDAFVFAPASGTGPIVLSKLWRRVRVEAGLPEGIGLHGLRHSLASHMAMGGAQAAEIMTALGHSQLSTAQRYVHWAKDARQSIAERAASVALAGLAASRGEAPAEVVELADKGR